MSREQPGAVASRPKRAPPGGVAGEALALAGLLLLLDWGSGVVEWGNLPLSRSLPAACAAWAIYLLASAALLMGARAAFQLVSSLIPVLALDWLPLVASASVLVVAILQGLDRYTGLQLAWVPVGIATGFGLRALRLRAAGALALTLLGVATIEAAVAWLDLQSRLAALPVACLAACALALGAWMLRARSSAALGATVAVAAALLVSSGLASRVGRTDPAGEAIGTGAAPDRNLLLITIDTLRADALSIYGAPEGSSPAIARLAERGTTFARAYSPAPWTLPSLAAVFSSRRPAELRSGPYTYATRDDWQPLAARLRGRGVWTCAAIANPIAEAVARGFEVVHSVNPRVAGDVLDVLPFLNELRSRWVLRGGELPFQGSTRLVTDAGVDCLDARAGRRFFVWVHVFDPHDPYVVSEREARAQGDVPAGRFAPDLFGDPGVDDVRAGRTFGLDDAFWERARGLYRGEVRRADSAVGRLLAALDERGLVDETLVVLTADHGEEFLDHGSFHHGHALYDESVHVPLVFAGPHVPRGQRRDQPVGLIDLMPTLDEALGLEPAADAQGRSLWRQIRDGSAASPRPVLAEATNYGEPSTALVLGDWKLIRYDRTGRTEVYDVVRDPGELRDLSAAEPERLRALLGALAEIEAGREAARGQAEGDAEMAERLRALGYIK